MANAVSLNSLQLQVALAQRQVAKDQAQVDADQAQLDQSQNQLQHDQRDLDGVQNRQRNAVDQRVAASTPTLSRAIDDRVKPPAPEGPVTATPIRASVNGYGQPIGQVINVAA